MSEDMLNKLIDRYPDESIEDICSRLVKDRREMKITIGGEEHVGASRMNKALSKEDVACIALGFSSKTRDETTTSIHSYDQNSQEYCGSKAEKIIPENLSHCVSERQRNASLSPRGSSLSEEDIEGNGGITRWIQMEQKVSSAYGMVHQTTMRSSAEDTIGERPNLRTSSGMGMKRSATYKWLMDKRKQHCPGKLKERIEDETLRRAKESTMRESDEYNEAMGEFVSNFDAKNAMKVLDSTSDVPVRKDKRSTYSTWGSRWLNFIDVTKVKRDAYDVLCEHQEHWISLVNWNSSMSNVKTRWTWMNWLLCAFALSPFISVVDPKHGVEIRRRCRIRQRLFPTLQNLVDILACIPRTFTSGIPGDISTHEDDDTAFRSHCQRLFFSSLRYFRHLFFRDALKRAQCKNGARVWGLPMVSDVSIFSPPNYDVNVVLRLAHGNFLSPEERAFVMGVSERELEQQNNETSRPPKTRPSSEIGTTERARAKGHERRDLRIAGNVILRKAFVLSLLDGGDEDVWKHNGMENAQSLDDENSRGISLLRRWKIRWKSVKVSNAFDLGFPVDIAFPTLGLGIQHWRCIVRRALDVLVCHLSVSESLRRCVVSCAKASKTAAESLNQSAFGGNVVRAIRVARDIFGLINLRVSSEDVKRIVETEVNVYERVLSSSASDERHSETEGGDIRDCGSHNDVVGEESNMSLDRAQTHGSSTFDKCSPGSYIVRARRHLCMKLFPNHVNINRNDWKEGVSGWKAVADDIVVGVLRSSLRLQRAMRKARSFALCQVNSLVRHVLEDTWRVLRRWQIWRSSHMKYSDLAFYQNRLSHKEMRWFVYMYAISYAECMPQICAERMRDATTKSLSRHMDGFTFSQKMRWRSSSLRTLDALVERVVEKARNRATDGCWTWFKNFQQNLHTNTLLMSSLIASNELYAFELKSTLSGISKYDWDHNNALALCFEKAVQSLANVDKNHIFVHASEGDGSDGRVLYPGAEDEKEHHETKYQDDNDKEMADDILLHGEVRMGERRAGDDDQFGSIKEGITNIRQENDMTTTTKKKTRSKIDDARLDTNKVKNPDLTLLMAKRNKSIIARALLPSAQRVCTLNDLSFSFGRAAYNVTANASRTIIPLFMIWDVDVSEVKSGKKYEVIIRLRYDRPKHSMYHRTDEYRFYMESSKSDALRRCKEFEHRISGLCGEKKNRVPPFPDVLEELSVLVEREKANTGAVSSPMQAGKTKSFSLDNRRTARERYLGATVDRGGKFSYANVVYENYGHDMSGPELYSFKLNEEGTGLADNVTRVEDLVLVKPSTGNYGAIFFTEMKSYGLEWTMLGYDEIDHIVRLTRATILQWTRGIVDAGKRRKEKNIVGGFKIMMKDGRGVMDESKSNVVHYFLAFEANGGRRYLEMPLFHMQEAMYRLSQKNENDNDTAYKAASTNINFTVHTFLPEMAQTLEDITTIYDHDNFKQYFYAQLDLTCQKSRWTTSTLETIMSRSMNITEKSEGNLTTNGSRPRAVVGREEFLENFAGAWEYMMGGECCGIDSERSIATEIEGLVSPVLMCSGRECGL